VWLANAWRYGTHALYLTLACRVSCYEEIHPVCHIPSIHSFSHSTKQDILISFIQLRNIAIQ